MEENCIHISKELPVAFGSFTKQDNWDYFFTLRGVDDFSEWNNLSFPPPPEELNILVPACGNSRLSENLYDEGFRNIINVDFSKVVISAMMKRNLRGRPAMKWRVMDITNIQFENGTFDAIVDKGGLDALMESELDSRSGILYISEVKRLLKAGGKYICLTLAEPHVLGLLFRKFRFGWKVNLYAIAQEPSSGTIKQHTFMLVAEKYILTVVSQVTSFMDECSVESHGYQVQKVFEALERENTVRAEYSNGADIWYSLEDLKQGVKGDIREIEPGRAVKLFLDDLVDGVKQRNIVHEVEELLFLAYIISAAALYVFPSPLFLLKIRLFWFIQVKTALSGTIYVEDVMLHMHPPKHVIFRRFCFERTESWVHSEVLLSTEEPNETSGQVEDKKGPAAFRTRKKGKPKKIDSHSSASSGQPKFERKVTVRGYHQGLIAGLMLFSVHSKRTTSAGGLVKTVIIGLGSGTLPMFMRSCLPTLRIEVVELDPVVLNVASEYFGFIEDERLKVHITDATKFVKEKANSEEEGNNSFKVDLLIIDVDSSDSRLVLLRSSGLISPEADFVEESFFLAVKDSLSDKGLFIFKLVSKFPSVKGAVYSKLKRVFSNVYHFYVDQDFVEIIFALKRDDPIIAENELAEACDALARSVEHNSQGWAKRALHNSKLIKPLP
ncbi:hypothetical protein MIMGU_mgv1a018471mg [Erythranthe guttata]|uniref:Methyltransferase type 11 domain-containing protein n=1 Tax=Erythranthe guttata TaxID=4155 RepID=A0A022S361_ERYGU|nr:hypothetical protein MIMGU_mgv1a018471mg [Erythranthe guttata]